ncbi:unnamed protein product [Caenorhabditis sp. 36 PRJEB53466]|nr:unnamed protein product [Caenorhabditis sp. 36 PRJEB53466]
MDGLAPTSSAGPDRPQVAPNVADPDQTGPPEYRGPPTSSAQAPGCPPVQHYQFGRFHPAYPSPPPLSPAELMHGPSEKVSTGPPQPYPRYVVYKGKTLAQYQETRVIVKKEST